VDLTAAQLHLVRRALDGNELDLFVTREQRAAIRELCQRVGADCEREKFLIAFKAALVETANEFDIVNGAERDAMLARLITVFIDELYNGARDRERRPETRGPVTAPIRLGLESDSSIARL
jgi:hypothetical protein